MYPSHNSQSSQFYYGSDRVVSTFENLGNMFVENITVPTVFTTRNTTLKSKTVVEIP